MEPSIFQQNDVLHLICGFVPPRTLPKLARVSRLLHYSVLPYIWKKLDQRTIACLTRGIDLTAQLMSHFKLHASLVQDLTLDFYLQRRFRPSLIIALDEIAEHAPATESVLPNLRRFRICASEASDLTYTHYFLGPSLYQLEVGCSGFNNQITDDGHSEKVVTELLLAIKSRCTNLHTLSFRGMPWLRDLPLVEQLLASLSTVTTYDGDGVVLSPNLLNPLARSTKLEDLKILMRPAQYDVIDPWGDLPLDGVYTDVLPLLENLRDVISPASFPYLRHIELNCDIQVATALLSFLHSTLQTITVVCSNRRGLIAQSDLDSLVDIMTTFATSLHDIDMTIIEPFDPLMRRGMPISWKTFAPFLRCSEIERFRLVYDSSDNFDFSQSSEISRAWRNIESFYLDWDPPARHRTKCVNHTGLHDPRSLSIVDMLQFAFHCPGLRNLLVAWLDASGSLTVPSNLPTVMWPLTLGVGYGQMECAPNVADFLRKVRPNVQLECRASYGPEGPRTAWKKVQELLKATRP
ncbi:hypothetical protein DACRYDRAFT_117062 [Dacryopinax primogenitus]|uniref:F-box domain-containing protein n=1 Tax=Dacryopinax primogenitus (strain DJM 731) TaxID=1858805 RepID=M5G404_DACPD|nr:uncharacterized protein DACRYDRAFT_117062 [Dacryopinax primogenitus]EJU00572.1 hypothetical protein DACRYDRAFT_117062 [Dacryopinax primogenitus]